jgi:preprotein translocase subunit YajC
VEILGSLPGSTAAGLATPLAAGSGGSSWSGPVVLALFVAVLYFAFFRPQRSRVRKAAELQREISPGQVVMTAGGLFGTVAAVEDDAVLLEVAPGVTTRWARQAIGRVVSTPEALGLETIDDPDPGSDASEAGPQPGPGSGPGALPDQNVDVADGMDPPPPLAPRPGDEPDR